VILGDNGTVSRDATETVTQVVSTDPFSGGADTIDGADGDDVIFGGTGNDLLVGGNGNDVLLGDHGLYLPALPAAQGGVVSILSAAANGGGSDAIDGDDGNDIIYGQQGDDLLAGGAGDDTYVFQDGFGSDEVLEGENSGYDTMDFVPVAAGVTVDFDPGGLMVFGPGGMMARSSVNVELVLLGSGAFAREVGGLAPPPEAAESGAVGLPGTGQPGPMTVLDLNGLDLAIPLFAPPPATFVYVTHSHFDAAAFARDRSQVQGDDGLLAAPGPARPGAGPAIAALTGSLFQIGGAQANQPVTVTGELANLAAPNLQAATITWGDGTSEPVRLAGVGPDGRLAGRHTYTQGGVYDLTLTLVTADGATLTRTAKARVTGAAIHDRTLQIVGTAGNDTVIITTNGRFVTVTAPFLPEPLTVPAAAFDVVVILTGAGQNRVVLPAGFAQPVVTDGAQRVEASPAPAAPAPPTAGIDWTGTFTAAPTDITPSLVEFTADDALAAGAKDDGARLPFPLSFLALDVLGRLTGPQPQAGAPGKRTEKSSGAGDREVRR
ncbi:MAG: hypothetical protein WC713_09400, partial [Candidatus Methylomirabilota bacterium]